MLVTLSSGQWPLLRFSMAFWGYTRPSNRTVGLSGWLVAGSIWSLFNCIGISFQTAGLAVLCTSCSICIFIILPFNSFYCYCFLPLIEVLGNVRKIIGIFDGYNVRRIISTSLSSREILLVSVTSLMMDTVITLL